jgi:Protein of unknown function (DUF2934)
LENQWQRGEIENLAQTLDLYLISPAELHQRISQLAYQFYLRRGKVDGYDLDDWLMAERAVLNRFTDIRLELGEPSNGEEI